MTDIAMCENQQCINSLDCFRFTAEASKDRQAYLMNTKEICEKDKYRFYIPNGAQQLKQLKGEQHIE